jgi:hypothetical protein
MVNAVFDHLIAIVLVGAIFIGTVVAMPAAIKFTNFQAADQQQLRNTASNVFNAILQGTGSPSNWGSSFPFNQNNVQTFGLAYSSSFSRYVLDSDKVQRLDPNSPGFIDYARIRDLLKLQRYGFRFSLYRPFKVGWDIQWGENWVGLNVNVTRTEDGTPIPNAQVKTRIIVTASNPNNEAPIFIVNEVPSKFTNLQGQCQINEPVTLPTGYTMESAIATIHIIVTGMDTMVVASKDVSVQQYLKINTFGDTVTLTIRGEYYHAPGARWVKMVYAYDLVDLVTVYDGDKVDKINQGEGDFEYWNSTFPGISTMDPAMLLFVFSVPNPRRLVVVAGPFSFSEPDKIFEFGATQPAGNVFSTTMRRFVVISGMTFVAELKLWREQK